MTPFYATTPVIVKVFTKPLPIMMLKSTSQSLARLWMKGSVNLKLCCVRAASGQDGEPPPPLLPIPGTGCQSGPGSAFIILTYAWRGNNKVSSYPEPDSGSALARK